MELKSRLAAVKKKAMKKIEQAAVSCDTRLVSSLSALASRIEEDEEVLAKLESRVPSYESEIGSDHPGDLGSILDCLREEARSTRTSKSRGRGDLGQIARQEFVLAGKERSYSLAQVSGVTYRTTAGKTVTIPFATERRPDRWFLGITDEKYDVIVLLCQNDDGRVLDFVLPHSMVSEFWEELSRAGGQVKLNVSRTGTDYWLVVPKHGKKRLNDFLAAYACLKK